MEISNIKELCQQADMIDPLIRKIPCYNSNIFFYCTLYTVHIIYKLRPNTSQAVPKTEGKIFQAIPKTEGRILQAVPLLEGLPVKSFLLRLKRMLLFPSEVRVAWVFLGISLRKPRQPPLLLMGRVFHSCPIIKNITLFSEG